MKIVDRPSRASGFSQLDTESKERMIRKATSTLDSARRNTCEQGSENMSAVQKVPQHRGLQSDYVYRGPRPGMDNGWEVIIIII